MSIAPARMIERAHRRRAAAEREACVVEVHEGSPPTLFHAGESFRLERLPVGSRRNRKIRKELHRIWNAGLHSGIGMYNTDNTPITVIIV